MHSAIVDEVLFGFPKYPIGCWHQLQFRFSYLGTGCHRVSAPFCHDLVCLFNFRGKALPHDLPALRDLRRVVDSSVCWDLYLFLRWSGILQALYMWNWQTEVSINNSIIFITNIHYMSKSVLRVKMVGSNNCTSLIYRYLVLTKLLKNSPILSPPHL